MRHREPAICLKTSDYSETSQVAVFLTRGAGVVRLLAKGAKRPKSKSGGALDLLGEGDLVFSISDRNPEALGVLMEFSETVSHTNLRADARRLNISLYLLEITASCLAEGDPHPEIFDLLHKALARLGEPDAPLSAVLAYFQWRLLRHVGLLGDLSACVECGKPIADVFHTNPAAAVFFSSRQGGVLCDACESSAAEKFRIAPAARAALAALAAVEARQKATLPAAQADAVNKLLAYHIAHQLGRRLKMTKYAIE